MNDSDLLRQYVRGSEPAFAVLVERHLSLVYGAALRQVRDPGLAEDVTQQVFIVLARKAPRLIGHRVLAAWLFHVTRFTALDALKMRARRERYEREAGNMAAQKSRADATRAEWDSVEPVLDEAMARLSGSDRTILLLRYWQDQSTDELAATLGISDDTVRKRLSRAADQLRKLLAREGAAVTAASLGPLLSANVLTQAPTHLTAKVLSGTTGKALASGSAAAKTTGILMATIKAKSVAAAVVAIAALGGALYVGKKVITPDDVPTKSVPIAGGASMPLPPPVADAEWKARFNSVYSLAPGEVVKYISPPFIPERATYYNTFEKSASGEKYAPDIWFTFSWDGSLHRLVWSNAKSAAGTALTDGLGVRPYQIEGPVDLWKLALPGDVICLKSAPPDERIKAFGSVLSTRLGRAIHFKKVHAVRDAIVVSGTYVPPKKPDGKNMTINVTPADLKTAPHPTSATYGNIDTYCSGLELQTRMQVINQIGTHYRDAVVFSTDRTAPGIATHPEQIQSLLNNLSQQTGLQYSLEPREIDLWTWVEG